MRKIGACFGLVVLLCSREAEACAPAPHAGEFVAVSEESALIIWEPATKTQHFIRRASFRGEAKDFGFLVPTPSVPKLAAVDESVFGHLQRKTSRQIVYETRKRIDWTPLLLFPLLMRSKSAPDVTAARAPVEVLSTQKVGGYEAAILDATDAEVLNQWLADHGYDTSPDLTEWLEAYIAQRWIISAFKIDKAQSFDARTETVRMSFTTERPYFPYREPASQRTGTSDSRRLSIWFVGPERVKGTVGANGVWPAEVKWSDVVKDLELGGVKTTPEHRLTYFEDTSNPRPGTDDLFFARDGDQSKLVPPPHVIEQTATTHVPADVVLAPILIVGWLLRRRFR
jgi:Uncharacterized protein conserved in bacteria (DUF2330)